MLFMLAGCLTITYTTGPEDFRPASHEEWHHRFMSGMIEVPGPFDAGEVCPGGVAQVRTETTVPNSLASAAVDALGEEIGVDASGAYTPSTISVWCERAP